MTAPTVWFTMRQDVSWVNADTYPAAGGCNVLCLTDRQLSIVRQMVYPHALSPSRFVVPGFDRRFTYPTTALLAEHVDEVDGLLDKLGGGTTMDCDALLDALDTIATRLVPSALVAVSDFNTSLAAGAQNRTIYTCPQYKVARITTVGYMYAGTAPSLLLVTMRKVGGSAIAFTAMKPPVSGIYYW